jgi:membrane dipeptidase
MRISLLALLLAWSIPATAQQKVDEGRLNRLLGDLLIIDTHIDTPRFILDEGYNFGVRNDYYETDIPRLRAGKVGALFFGAPVSDPPHPPYLWPQRVIDQIDTAHETVRQYPNDLEFAYTADDIERIHRAGKVAILMSVEGGHAIVDDLAILRSYYRLGVRYMTLTHFKTNNWADSSTDRAIHNGLSDYGREVVREMNRLGMMVDISHVSDKTFFDAIEASRAPAMASHSSVKALCDTPRNMTDELIKALAAKDGVVFINFNAAYLDNEGWDIHNSTKGTRDREVGDMMRVRESDPARFDLKRSILKRYARLLPPVDYNAVLRHIDHVVKLVGPNHVGFGSDFDGISGMAPRGMEDVSMYPTLVRGMMAMGYSDEDIRKIAGGNLLRIMRRAEAVAAEMAGETN